ncbi:hypothetical protein CDD82_2838 [Ophiocordyceps australis]|uniref:RING-type E3 ubiquitin transferase n=1 Tax=Ophiocordyceps australis TaxID=1399860 RepID=A0A2C5ZHZ1_9HYPO|nr:hypothetical protein CDD82_2838 [Ophiocordyceps australis]
MPGAEGGTSSGRTGGSRGRQNRGRSSRRGRAGGANGHGHGGQAQPLNPAAQDVASEAARARVKKQGADGDGAAGNGASAAGSNLTVDGGGNNDDEAEVCFICANPVAHYSIAPCNHTTCHICGLRMRALYKTKDCAHCRTPAPFVIFTDDSEKRFQDYGDADITTTDTNIGIKYAKEDMVGDTVLLLRYNCPDASCDFAGLGWPDLHRHVKSAHRKRMCDLCTRNKKVFTHEHELFADRELERHVRHGDADSAGQTTGFKGHPLCEFCGERFYDDDKLYEHCRMKHERCFICDRRDSRKPHYFMNYDALEQHFRRDHYLCLDRECMEKKFVVFESEMDLQAHNLSEHGAAKAAGRDARLVDMSSFALRQSYQQERRRGGGGAGAAGSGARGARDGPDGSRGRGRGRGRGRDPNADAVPPVSTQPLRRDEVAFQRQMAIHSAQSLSNRSFGQQLTSQASVPTCTSSPAPRAASSSSPSITDPLSTLSISETSSLTPGERARIVRHSAVIERATNLVANDAAKVSEFRQLISSYNGGRLSAPQLLDAFLTLFADVSSNALATLVREIADLFDDATRADGLRSAWRDWRAINDDYPSLPGIGGMHGATTASSGWAAAAAANPAVPNAAPAQLHSTRVLRLKNSTRLGAPPAPAAGFPALAAASRPAPTSTPPPARTPSAPRLSWASGSASAPSTEAFPALPAAPKPTTTIFGYGSGRGVRRDYGNTDTGFSWGSGSSSAAAAAPQADETEAEDKKPRRGGKRGKRVLVQWG